MNSIINNSLSELIQNIVSGTVSSYTFEEIERLKIILRQKVIGLLDPTDKEFYHEVVEELIYDINEIIENTDSNFVDLSPLVAEFNTLDKKVNSDIEISLFMCEKVEELYGGLGKQKGINSAKYSTDETPEERALELILEKFAHC